MIVPAETFRAAIAEHVGEDLAEHLKLPSEVDDDLLSSLFAPVFGAEMLAADLVDVTFTNPELVTLPRNDALAHPLLRDWLEVTLGEALVAPIRAGLRAHYLAFNAPEFGPVSLITRQRGIMAGAIQLRFPSGAFVTALYGSAATTALQSTTTLKGEALLRAGAAMRSRQVVPEPADAAPVEARRYEVN